MQKFNHAMNESPVVQRFSARTQEEATRICPNCGTIPGREVLLQGSIRYVTGICACQRAAHDQEVHDQRRFEWMQQQKRRTFSWLGERWEDRALLDKTLDNFDQRPQPYAYQAVQDFIMEMRGNLVLHGTWGTGKTHLLAAICNEVRQLEISSLFVSALKLFSAIQGKIANHEDYTQILTSAIQTKLLALDDVDKAECNRFRSEIYFQIVDERVKARRPIAISTNKLDELEKYVGGAVCSRLKVGQIDIPMLGIDYRETLDIA